jgi:hypothetical protein
MYGSLQGAIRTRVRTQQRRHEHTGPDKRVNNCVRVRLLVAGAPLIVVGHQHPICPFLG